MAEIDDVSIAELAPVLRILRLKVRKNQLNLKSYFFWTSLNGQLHQS